MLISYNKKLFDLLDNNFLLIFGLFQMLIGIFFGSIKLYFENKINLSKILCKDYVNIITISNLSLLYNFNSIYGIKYNNIGMNQLIKMSEPLFGISINYIFYSKKININNIFIILFGLFLSLTNIKNNDSFYNSSGIIYSILSNILSSIKMIQIKKQLENKTLLDNLGHINNLYFLINIFSFVIGICFYILYDLENIYNFINLINNNRTIKIYLFSTSILFYLLNEIYLQIINKVDLTTQSVLFVSKNLIIMILFKNK
jgi:hypothetical protein